MENINFTAATIERFMRVAELPPVVYKYFLVNDDGRITGSGGLIKNGYTKFDSIEDNEYIFRIDSGSRVAIQYDRDQSGARVEGVDFQQF